MGDLGLWTVFGSEVVGTAVLILLGTGVVANVSPARTYGTGGGVGVITLGWGLGVFAGVRGQLRHRRHVGRPRPPGGRADRRRHGSGLGGPTGYAINPARDLGPRIAHALLPIRGKGGSNWSYAWVPVVGPLAGAVPAGLFSHVSI